MDGIFLKYIRIILRHNAFFCTSAYERQFTLRHNLSCTLRHPRRYLIAVRACPGLPECRLCSSIYSDIGRSSLILVVPLSFWTFCCSGWASSCLIISGAACVVCRRFHTICTTPLSASYLFLVVTSWPLIAFCSSPTLAFVLLGGARTARPSDIVFEGRFSR